MEILDGTVIAPAAPLDRRGPRHPAVDVNVAISGYLLTVAVLIPISGWLADRFGPGGSSPSRSRCSPLASTGCAFAPDLTMLTATRVLQGIGGAMMVPVGRLAVLRATAKSRPDPGDRLPDLARPARPRARPALGGSHEYASWRWIFVINVPLGVAGLLLGRRLVPDMRAGRPPRLDWRGFVLTAIGSRRWWSGPSTIGGGAIELPFVAGDRAGGRAAHLAVVATCCGAPRRCSTCASCGSRASGSPRGGVGVPDGDQSRSRSCCR